MKDEKLGELLLDGLLVTQDGGHVCLQPVHVLTDGDLVFLGLIPVHIKPCGQVMSFILECRRRTDRGLFM